MTKLDDVAKAVAEELIRKENIALSESACLDLARAAIAPLMEPSPFMLEATTDEAQMPRILEFTSPDERSEPFIFPRFAWRCMAKAILKEHEQ